MKGLFIFIISFIITVSAFATHNRAGEITYRYISQYTYEFTITTFTWAGSPVEKDSSISQYSGKWVRGRPDILVDWGDNTSNYVPKSSRIVLPEDNSYIKSTFIATHTFPGPGIYKIIMQDPNRNDGVKNIPNSVNVVFSVKTTILINPEIGPNNSPVLLNYPIDKAALGKIFKHNPGAYDPDGDSISYSIGICLREKGIQIENYTLPKASDSIYIDTKTGDLIWQTPVDTGIFNIAINVEEWRNGIKIGVIVRDIQIEVYNTKNHPPENKNLKNFCIEAGTTIKTKIIATDPDNDLITQTATGSPFLLNDNSITFKKDSATAGYSSSILEWKTNYNHIRNQPYFITIKAKDNNKEINLVDIDNISIKIIAPAPKIISAKPGNSSISVSWNKTNIPKATGYAIYRSAGPSTLLLDSCNGGLPENSAYVKIGYKSAINDTILIDDNNGKGLDAGINYCYRIVTLFADGALSYPSNEVCATLLSGVPSMTSASVTVIDSIYGSVFISWIKPSQLDTIPAPGPYEYLIYRTDNLDGNNFTLIQSLQTNDLNDTTYTDTDLNTYYFPYFYKIELYNNTPGNRFIIGNFETASTLYPEFVPNDNQLTIKFIKKVPWFNTTYIVYRKNPLTLTFDSIGYTNTGEYTDRNLANNVAYTYRVLSLGFREKNGLIYNTTNWSHINSNKPIDKTPPCPPELNLLSICDSSINILSWKIQQLTCNEDIIGYNIYFKKNLDDNFSLLDSINNVYDTTYRHNPTDGLAACYAVTAIDSFRNESALSNIKCFAGCSGYSLPNFFTPNNDDIYETMVSYNPNNYVKSVDMKIYNRWGKLVYETTDPGINWDGREKTSKQLVSEGVYYYVCIVNEPHLGGILVKPLTGFVYVLYSTKKKIYQE